MGPSPVHVGIPKLVSSVSGATIVDFSTAEDNAAGLVATPVSCEAAANEVLRGSVIVLNVSSPVVGTLLPNADPVRAQCSLGFDGYVHSSGTEVLNQELALKRNNHDVDYIGSSQAVQPLLFGNQCLVPQEEALDNLVSTSSSYAIVTESNEIVAKVNVPEQTTIFDKVTVALVAQEDSTQANMWRLRKAIVDSGECLCQLQRFGHVAAFPLCNCWGCFFNTVHGCRCFDPGILGIFVLANTECSWSCHSNLKRLWDSFVVFLEFSASSGPQVAVRNKFPIVCLIIEGENGLQASALRATLPRQWCKFRFLIVPCAG